MKYISLLLSSILVFGSIINSNAQIPEKIYGKNKVLKPNEYYIQQLELWKTEVNKNPKNADAWYNYYRANRNAYIKGEEDNSQKAKGTSRFKRLQTIVDDMEKAVPSSYEFNFVKWLNGNNDPSLFPFLEKAHTLSPKSPEPIMSLIFYYEIQGNYDLRNKNIEKYYSLGDYSPGLLNFSYNLLSELEKDAIVFTEGDKDTEAILLLQQGRKYRPDVKMLNLNLLLMNEYRERVFKELELPPLDFAPLQNEETYKKFQQVIIKHVANNPKGRPVHSSVTVSTPYTYEINNSLYLTGLTYLYNIKPVENMTILKNNIEELFLLDYIKEYFPIDLSVGNVNSMNGNYLPAFAELSRYYANINNNTKADYYQALALKVAKAAERMGEYETYFTKK